MYFIVGPTAVGKTDLSLAAARALNAEILSCDSLCVYKGMDIGTAKPTAAERASVPHHGIDLVAASRLYSVGEYVVEAKRVITDILGRGKQILVVGGSGFYLKSFFEPVMDQVEVSEMIQAEVAAIEAEKGLAGLVEALQVYNRDGLGRLDWQNPRRVSTALIRCLASGDQLSTLQAAFAALPKPFAGFSKQVCLLRRDSDALRQRVRQRVEMMFTEGLLDEVKRLQSEGIEANPSAARSIGYREPLAYLNSGGTDEAALKEEIAVHTNQLIRKQRTWFRRQVQVDREVDAGSATIEQAFDLRA